MNAMLTDSHAVEKRSVLGKLKKKARKHFHGNNRRRYNSGTTTVASFVALAATLALAR